MPYSFWKVEFDKQDFNKWQHYRKVCDNTLKTSKDNQMAAVHKSLVTL